MQVGDLVKIKDPKKQSWITNNPWMAIAWGMNTVYIITDKRTTTAKKPVSLYKIVNPKTGDYKWAQAGEVEVISEVAT